jgi:hypothetical protein
MVPVALPSRGDCSPPLHRHVTPDSRVLVEAINGAPHGRKTGLIDTFRYVVRVRVDFFKAESHGRPRVVWEATRGKRTRIPGTTMAGNKGIPHDLGQYVIEAATGYRNGFWDLISKGATFNSTGRRRTKPGRAVIAEHRAELAGAEALAAFHLQRWNAGDTSPVSEALSRALDQWTRISIGERLSFEWPCPRGMVTDKGGSS